MTQKGLKKKVSKRTIRKPHKYYDFHTMQNLVRIHILAADKKLNVSVTLAN